MKQKPISWLPFQKEALERLWRSKRRSVRVPREELLKDWVGLRSLSFERIGGLG